MLWLKRYTASNLIKQVSFSQAVSQLAKRLVPAYYLLVYAPQ
jgi:hypothetical protein